MLEDENMPEIEEKDLREILQKTIDDYFGNRGGFSGPWFFLAEGLDGDGDSMWVSKKPLQQSPAATLGLLKVGSIAAESDVYSIFDANDDDCECDGCKDDD